MNIIILDGIVGVVGLLVLGAAGSSAEDAQMDLEDARHCRVTGPVEFHEGDEGPDWLVVGRSTRLEFGGSDPDFRALKAQYENAVLTVDYTKHSKLLLEMRDTQGRVIYCYPEYRPPRPSLIPK